MASIIRMPSVLAGSEEAAIAHWLVSEGQSIAVGEPLAEIETEKAIVEYNAEEAGIVGRVVLAAGESGEIGAPIAVLIAEGETAADIDAALGGAAAEPAPAPAPAEAAPARDPESAAPVVEADSVERAARDADTVDPADPSAATATTTGAEPAQPSAGAREGAPQRLFVSPIARKLAREHGLDASAIAGSGPDGRIVRRDVEAALAAGPVPVAAAGASAAAATPATASSTPTPAAGDSAAAAGDWELVPHTGMRRAIARRLTESKSTVPHFYLTAEPRVDALLALRAEVNSQSPVRVSVNDFV